MEAALSVLPKIVRESASDLKAPGLNWKWLALLFGCSFLIRIIYISFLKEGYYFSDFRVYEQSALSLLSGQGFGVDYSRPPLYPLFISAHYLIFGNHIFFLRLSQALLGAIVSVLIVLVGSLAQHPRVGYMAGWISAFYPYYIFLSGLLYPTLMSTAFLVSVILFLVLAYKPRRIIWILPAGISLGLSALATPVSLVFLPFAGLSLIFQRTWLPIRRWLSAGLLVGTVLLTLLPWTAYYYIQHGRLILVDPRAESHVAAASGSAPETTQNSGQSSRLQVILAQPGEFLLNYGREFLHFWTFIPDRVVTRDPEYRDRIHQMDPRLQVDNPFTSDWLNYVSVFTYGPVLILAGLGVVLSFDRMGLLSLPFWLLISQALGYSLFFTQVRYRLPVEFCLMIFAGVAGVKLLNSRSALKAK